tara:strand:- start:876 stop:1688 length:813 start_codon:yes stop_codon:yes gene_type:complete
MATTSNFTQVHHVWLDLSSRSPFTDDADTATMKTFETNRIGLKCDSVAISTSKNIMAFPTPAIGIATGHSVSLGLDLGMSTKNISISGIITEQFISKQFSSGDLPKSKTDSTLDASHADYTYTDADGKYVKVFMTAQEVSQLMHSYVDASFMQTQQNLNKLIILIPSRVGPNFTYHDKDEAGNALTTGSATTLENCPLIPFNYGVRDKGSSSKLDATNSISQIRFPKPIDTSKNITKGISGFVRSFDTTFVGGQPFVEFSLSFEVALSSL